MRARAKVSYIQMSRDQVSFSPITCKASILTVLHVIRNQRSKVRRSHMKLTARGNFRKISSLDLGAVYKGRPPKSRIFKPPPPLALSGCVRIFKTTPLPGRPRPDFSIFTSTNYYQGVNCPGVKSTPPCRILLIRGIRKLPRTIDPCFKLLFLIKLICRRLGCCRRHMSMLSYWNLDLL